MGIIFELIQKNGHLVALSSDSDGLDRVSDRAYVHAQLVRAHMAL